MIGLLEERFSFSLVMKAEKLHHDQIQDKLMVKKNGNRRPNKLIISRLLEGILLVFFLMAKKST